MLSIRRRSLLAMLLIPVAGLLCSGCSLMKIELGGDPMPRTEMNARVSAHEFAEHFALVVEAEADSILADSTDRMVQMSALRWKINSIDAIRAAAFRTHPYGAQVDCWTLCYQMVELLDTGGGATAFGPYQPRALAVSRQLLNDAEEMVSNYMPEERQMQYGSFIVDYVATHPIVDLTFAREPSTPAFLDYLDVPDSARVQALGTLPQVVHNYGSQMSIWSDQWPRQSRWRTELLLMERNLDQVDLRGHIDSLTAYADRIATIMETSPQVAREITDELVAGLDPVLVAAERQRIAIMQGLNEQRIALTETIQQEREIILASVDVTAIRVTDVAMTRLREGLTAYLLWLSIMTAIVLGLPFVIGYITGRAVSRSRRVVSET